MNTSNSKEYYELFICTFKEIYFHINRHIYRTLKLAVGSGTVVQHSDHNYEIDCSNPAADIR